MNIEVLASGSSGNAYRISDGASSLLIDCGIPYQHLQRACKFTLHALSGCLVTHSHLDHVKAAQKLLESGTEVYTSNGTAEAARLSGHRLHIVKPLERFQVGTFEVLPFDVEHDAPEPLGFLIRSMETGEKLLYFTDTAYVKYKFKGVHYFMCECNFDSDIAREQIRRGVIRAEQLPRLHQTHMSLEHLIEFFRANDLTAVKAIYLLHLSSNNSNEARFIEKIQEVTGVHKVIVA